MNEKFKIFGTIFNFKNEIILRDYLALERTKLANERTLLAYSRTSLYMLLGGIAFLQLQDFRNIRWIGYLAIFLSIILVILGIYRYIQIRYRLSQYYRKSRENSQE
jgi:putative membrane protein